jgi:hypothetical protein
MTASSARFSPLTLGLALFVLLGVLGIGILQTGLGQPGVASELRLFASGVQGVDSWRPMNLAHAYLVSGAEQPLYQRLFFEQRIKFIYPPTSLLLIDAVEAAASKSLLRSVLGFFSWVLVLLTAAFSVALLDRLLEAAPATRARGRPDRIARWGLCAVAALAFYPVLKAYSLGQMQVWVNALFAVFLYAWVAGWKRTAGVLVACMAAVKPQYGVFVVWGLLRREPGFVAAAAAAGALLLAVSIGRFGWESHLDYLSVLGHVSRLGEAYWPNQTLNGFLQRLLDNGVSTHWDPHVYPPYHAGVHVGTLVGGALLLGAALWLPARTPSRAGPIDLAATGLALTMASPVAWEHHYGVLLPILALLLPALLCRPLLGRATLPVFAIGAAIAGNAWLALGALSGTAWNPLQSLLLFVALGTFAIALALCVAPGRPESEAG